MLNYVSGEVSWHLRVIQIRFGVTCHVYDVGWSVVYTHNTNTVWCDMSCVWCWVERGLRHECSGWHQTRQVRHSERDFDELWRSWWVGADQSWHEEWVSVVWSSGDVSYRVNRVYCWAGKAASNLGHVWMLLRKINISVWTLHSRHSCDKKSLILT